MDGIIRIGTKLDTKPLEKELRQAEKELKQFEKEAEKLTTEKIEIEAKVKVADSEYKKQVADLKKSYGRSIMPAYAGGTSVSEQRKLEIARQYEEQLNEINQKYLEQIKPLEDINKKIKENANNQNSWKEKISETKAELDKIKGQNNLSKGLSKGFDKALKSAKKLVIGIIGVRAAYSLIRKASSSYLADNEETTSKISSLWTGLGTIMGPVIEMIVNLLKKAVTAVLQFMSVLTGTNYIAKANEAILNKQAKATKNLTKATQKYTASFDEMNVLNDNSDNGADNSVTSLFDINDLSENTRKAIDNIAKALKPVYEILKEIIKFSLEHPEVILGILGGVGLLSMLGKIIGVAGTGTVVGTGLAGILGVLLAIASIGVITISFKKVIEETEKYKEEQEGAQKTLEGNVKTADKFRKNVRKLVQDQEKGTEAANKSASAYKTLNQTSADHVKVLIEEGVQTKGFNKLINDQIGRTESLGRQIKTETNEMFKNIIALGESYKAGKLDEQGKKDYFETLTSVTDITELATLSTDELANKFLISTKEAENLKTQYNIVATELYRMYKNGDITVNILDKMPKEVRTKIENNFDKNIDLLDQVYDLINNLPIFKMINVETKVTADTSSAKSSLERLFANMTSGIKLLDNVLGTNLAYKFSQIKLARGGIVNNPGRGVSIGTNIIAGEAGPEAVLPLTDDTLQRLANMIPINVTVMNTMNGRVISRELQKVQNDSDFAYNR